MNSPLSLRAGITTLLVTDLVVGGLELPGEGGNNPAMAGSAMWDPDTSPGSNNNDVWLNVLDPSQVSDESIRVSPLASPNSPASGWFNLSNLGLQGTRWYCQLLVQEYVVTGSPGVPTKTTKTGRWAGSRGHWFGVARS